MDAVPLSLPELVVQKSSKGSKQLTSFAREDCAAMEDTVTETEGIDGDITEAFVLSPTTSMTVLSRAISGEGSAAAAADDDDDKVETVPIDETVHTDVSSTGSAVECTVDALQVTNEENDDEHMYGYRKVAMPLCNQLNFNIQ